MRQRISLPVVCGLLAAGLVTGPATTPANAANAAEPVFRLAGPAALALRPHPATGSPQPAPLAFRLERPAAGGNAFSGEFSGEFTFTVDLSKVAGVATVRENPAGGARKCTPSGSTLVCEERGPRPAAGPVVDLEIAAAPGSAEKASGEVTVTGQVAGATVTAAVTTVTVGGPDLVMGEMKLKRDPKPGESQPLPLTFTNRGTQPAKGVVLELEATHGLDFAERYDNCAYTTGRTATTALCTVEGDFQVDETYELAGDSPLHLKTTAHARTERLGYGIHPAAGAPQKTEQPAADGPNPRDPAAKTPSKGRKLAARQRAAVLVPAQRGADLDPRDNSRSFDFAVANTADFSAEPLSLRAKAGATVKAAVVLRNHGPAWVGDHRSEAPAAVVEVRIPPGLKVTKAPEACKPVRPADLADYVCGTGPSVLETEKIEFAFEAKVEKAVPNARGAITVRKHAFDPNAANNTAAFVVNAKGSTTPSPSPSTGTPSPSASASATPSVTSSASATPAATAQGGGGPLASTGATAGPLALGAAVLVAAGGVLYLASRRRSAA
ncbi:hypothetical protein ACWDYJ_25170 [Streptomyces sp. NPDC003042]